MLSQMNANNCEKDPKLPKKRENPIQYHIGRGGRGRPGRRTKEMLAIANERIKILMELAEDAAINDKNPSRARRYVQLARNIGMKYNIRMGREYNIKFCRTCNEFLGASTAAQTRFRHGKMIITCKKCGRVKRIRIR